MRSQVLSPDLFDDDVIPARSRALRNRRNSRHGQGTAAEGRQVAERQAASELAFRNTQAKMARTLLSPDLTGLARELAELAIDLFPTVIPNPLKGRGRTRVATEAALTRLSKNGPVDENAVNLGIDSAHAALTEAFNARRRK